MVIKKTHNPFPLLLLCRARPVVTCDATRASHKPAAAAAGGDTTGAPGPGHTFAILQPGSMQERRHLPGVGRGVHIRLRLSAGIRRSELYPHGRLRFRTMCTRRHVRQRGRVVHLHMPGRVHRRTLSDGNRRVRIGPVHARWDVCRRNRPIRLHLRRRLERDTVPETGTGCGRRMRSQPMRKLRYMHRRRRLRNLSVSIRRVRRPVSIGHGRLSVAAVSRQWYFIANGLDDAGRSHWVWIVRVDRRCCRGRCFHGDPKCLPIKAMGCDVNGSNSF